eukprot:Nk52_evm40s78 gene=Nk52_evmTU40s78
MEQIISIVSENPLLYLGGFVATGTAFMVFIILSSGPKVALNPKEKIAFKLVKKTKLSHDTRLFRFALQSPEHILGLPIGKHMSLSARIDGKPVVRYYTPVSCDDDVGYFDLVVKVYFRDVHPKFPEGGKMSQHLEAMNIGDSIDVRGPLGKITYKGKGGFEHEDKKTVVQHKARKIGMIAGGTGITPMLQVIRAILKNKDDRTEVYLIFANQTEEDILLREELDACATDKRFYLWYTLDRPPTDGSWKYSKGFIDYDMCKDHLPAPGEDSYVFLCGPPPMIKFACMPNLEKMGYAQNKIFAF